MTELIFRPVLVTISKIFKQKYNYFVKDNLKIVNVVNEVWEDNEWKIYGHSESVFDSEDKLISEYISNRDLMYSERDRLGIGIENEYDENGNILTTVLQNIYMFQKVENNLKTDFKYNENKKLITELIFVWDNGKWNHKSRINYQYDLHFSKMVHLEDEWINNIWVNKEKISYDYDSNHNKILEIYEKWNNDSWEYDNRIKYEYNSKGLKGVEINEDWGNKDWIPVNKIHFEYNHKGNMYSKKIQEWKESNWDETSQVDYEYDSNGNCIYANFNNYAYKTMIYTLLKYNQNKDFLNLKYTPLKNMYENIPIHDGNFDIHIAYELRNQGSFNIENNEEKDPSHKENILNQSIEGINKHINLDKFEKVDIIKPTYLEDLKIKLEEFKEKEREEAKREMMEESMKAALNMPNPHLVQNPKKGCYIATMAYGSYDHPQVKKLRKFRDNYLLQNFTGRLFVKVYYFISPHLVQALRNKPYINKMTRKILDILILISFH
ncbi:MAG: hypothetical protein PF487_14220 [Bacteroidales bacterium]|jgi:hypothetical protein|nr:hypothetical protein [Bacteroidales bacterium]